MKSWGFHENFDILVLDNPNANIPRVLELNQNYNSKIYLNSLI
jgi:hypothetical protein